MPKRNESGVATVAAVAMVGCVLLVAAALAQVGLVIAAKHRVQAAADLAALAGSAASLRGDDGCSTARQVAERNGAEVAYCRADLAVVTVRTGSTVRDVWGPSVVWGARFRVEADARAAPDFYVASRSTRSSSRTAPALFSGSLPLPHFGD